MFKIITDTYLTKIKINNIPFQRIQIFFFLELLVIKKHIQD